MDFITLTWLFVVATAVHNAEEALWLPAWSRTAGRWHGAVGATEFRFAVAVLTVLAAFSAWLAAMQGKESLGTYLVSGYALAMTLNAIFPHFLATFALRRYMPGTATGMFLNLPIGVALLTQAMSEGYIDAAAFLRFGPLVVIGLLASIPLLFGIGRGMAELNGRD